MNKLYEEEDVRAIANNLRARLKTENTFTLHQMAPAINNIISVPDNFKFNGHNSPAIINQMISQTDTSGYTNMSYMFADLTNTSLDLSNFNTSNVTSMVDMFYNCTKVTSLDVSGLDTSNVTDMFEMFRGVCSGLSYSSVHISPLDLDLSNFNTENVTRMTQMFYDCWARVIDLSSFDTSNVTNMQSMFRGARYLQELDLSNFDTSNVTDMKYMFLGLGMYTNGGMTTLDLTSFDTSSVLTMEGMFQDLTGGGCPTRLDLSSFTARSEGVITTKMFDNAKSLTYIDMSNFDFTKAGTHTSMFGSTSAKRVPANCEILVKDQTQKDWFTTNFSWLTNVQIKA